MEQRTTAVGNVRFGGQNPDNQSGAGFAHVQGIAVRGNNRPDVTPGVEDAGIGSSCTEWATRGFVT